MKNCNTLQQFLIYLFVSNLSQYLFEFTPHLFTNIKYNRKHCLELLI